MEPAFLHWKFILFSTCPRFDPPSLATVRLSLTLTFFLLTIWCSKQTALFLFFLAKAALAYLPTALLEATLSFSAGPECSSFSAEACAFLQALCWSRQHQKVCHFSSPLCPRHLVFSVLPFTSISMVDLAGTVFVLLLFYQTTMCPRTLVSPGERSG